MRSADRCKGIGYVQYQNEVCCNMVVGCKALIGEKQAPM